MTRVQSFYKFLLREPLWFRAVLGISLLVSIVFSSSAFTLGGYAGIISKLFAAIFFFAFGVKMRRNRKISLVFLGISVLCLYLAWDALS